MLSLLAQFFCCCVGVRTHDDPDQVQSTAAPIATERSRLIDPPTPPAIVNAIEDPTIRERMDTIVRSKEGKMFSVGMRAPLAGSNPRVHTLTPARSQESLYLVTQQTQEDLSPSGTESSVSVALSMESGSEFSVQESSPNPSARPLDSNSTSGTTILPINGHAIAFDW